MKEELSALHNNDTWVLVPRNPNMNVVGSKWVFKTKLKPDGNVERYKACLVAKGYSQMEGIYFDETFSLVIKPTTTRTILTIAVVHKWPLNQLDVKKCISTWVSKGNSIYGAASGFVNPSFPNHVCHLKRALYGLKQSPRAWFERFSLFLLQIGFSCSRADSSLYILHCAQGTILLLL